MSVCFPLLFIFSFEFWFVCFNSYQRKTDIQIQKKNRENAPEGFGCSRPAAAVAEPLLTLARRPGPGRRQLRQLFLVRFFSTLLKYVFLLLFLC